MDSTEQHTENVPTINIMTMYKTPWKNVVKGRKHF